MLPNYKQLWTLLIVKQPLKAIIAVFNNCTSKIMIWDLLTCLKNHLHQNRQKHFLLKQLTVIQMLISINKFTVFLNCKEYSKMNKVLKMLQIQLIS